MEQPSQSPPNPAFLVRRTIRLTGALSAEQESVLRELDGVLAIEPKSDSCRIAVRYNTARTTYKVLLQALQSAGASVHKGVIQRLRTVWYGYVDDNARRNAESTGGACCSQPDKVYLSRHK